MEADLANPSASNTILVIGHFPITGSEDAGAHAVIRVKIAQHLFGSAPGADLGLPA